MATTMLNQRPAAGQGLRSAQLGWEQVALRCFCSCQKSVTYLSVFEQYLPWGWGEECWSNLIGKTRFIRVFCEAPTKSWSSSGRDLEWDIVLVQHLKAAVALFNYLSDRSKTLSSAIQIFTPFHSSPFSCSPAFSPEIFIPLKNPPFLERRNNDNKTTPSCLVLVVMPIPPSTWLTLSHDKHIRIFPPSWIITYLQAGAALFFISILPCAIVFSVMLARIYRT